jgi:hypothetical protein
VNALAALEGLEEVNRGLQRDLGVAHAENLGLRALLDEHGITAPTPDGVVTLGRLRALENVLNLAYLHVNYPTPERAGELRAAILDAGRRP